MLSLVNIDARKVAQGSHSSDFTSRAVLLQPRSRALGVSSCYGAHSSRMRGWIKYGVSAAAAVEGARERGDGGRRPSDLASEEAADPRADEWRDSHSWNSSAYLARGHSSGLKRRVQTDEFVPRVLEAPRPLARPLAALREAHSESDRDSRAARDRLRKERNNRVQRCAKRDSYD